MLPIELFSLGFAPEPSKFPIGYTVGELVMGVDYYNFTWEKSGPYSYAGFKASGKKYYPEYIPSSNVKGYGGEYYVNGGRMGMGVPSVINKMVQVDGEWKAQPWPSWEWMEEGDCDKLQMVQAFEMDSHNHEMYVMDSGSTCMFSFPDWSYPYGGCTRDTTCPPKMMVFDLKTGALKDKQIVPRDVVDHENGWLNDLSIDIKKKIVYMSDTFGGGQGDDSYWRGGVVVWNRKTRTFKRFEDISTYNDPTGVGTQVIGGYEYDPGSTVAANGMAMSPDGSRVYYKAIQALAIYSVDAAVLADPASTNATIAETVINHGPLKGIGDGMTMDCKGYLFVGGITANHGGPGEALYRSKTPLGTGPMDPVLVEHDKDKLQWVDGFGFDAENGKMLVMTNHLNTFFPNFGGVYNQEVGQRMIFTDGGRSGMGNFRIVAYPSPGDYVEGPC